MIALLVILLIFTVILLSGHGAWFVAGYNTMNEQERRKYNATILSRSVGVLFLFISLFLLARIIIDYNGLYTEMVNTVFIVSNVVIVFGFALWMIIAKPYRENL